MTGPSISAPARLDIERLYEARCHAPNSDISEHLPILRYFAAKCNRVAEMGVRYCVSTFAFLMGLSDEGADAGASAPKQLVCVDIEEIESIHEIAHIAKHIGVDLSFIRADSATVDLGGRVDLLFIDTWHVYGHLKRELEAHHGNVNKYIIMHDTTVDGVHGESIRLGMDVDKQCITSGYAREEIMRGLVPAIDEFLVAHPEWRRVLVLENQNGLTVLARRVV